MRNTFNKLTLFFAALAFSLSSYAGLNYSNSPQTSAFANLPAATAVAPFNPYLVTDIGTGGSLWVSNGSQWSPVGGSVNVFQTGIPMALPPSGSIAAGTGVLTLGTALDQVYPNIYFWMPAGAWTGSTAGMYYASCTTTTTCTIYQNQYVSGVPTIPSSPTLVTTGAGAYTQTTGVYLAVAAYVLPANAMGVNGKLSAQIFCTNNSSAGVKAAQAANPLVASGYGNTTGTAFGGVSYAENIGVANRQFVQWNSASTSTPNYGSISTTINLTITPMLYLATATDWIILQNYQLTLSR